MQVPWHNQQIDSRVVINSPKSSLLTVIYIRLKPNVTISGWEPFEYSYRGCWPQKAHYGHLKKFNKIHKVHEALPFYKLINLHTYAIKHKFILWLPLQKTCANTNVAVAVFSFFFFQFYYRRMIKSHLQFSFLPPDLPEKVKDFGYNN